MDMNDFFAMGFCKVAEEHGVDPVQLAKYAQQLPMSSYNQRRIAELKAMAAKLKGGTPQTVTTNADGSVSSKWSGHFRGGELVPPASVAPQAPAAQPQPTSPVQTQTPSAPVSMPTPSAPVAKPKLAPGMRYPRPGEYDSSWTPNEDGSFSKGNTTSYPLDPNAILAEMAAAGIK